MKKIIVTALVLAMLLSLCGCVTKDRTDDESAASGNNRFVTVYSQAKLTNFIYIVRDTETDIEYLVFAIGDGCGVCKLEDGAE